MLGLSTRRQPTSTSRHSTMSSAGSAPEHNERSVFSRWMTESSLEVHDDAVDGRGYARHNQQTEEYVPTAASGFDDGLCLPVRALADDTQVNTELNGGEVTNATLEGGKTPGEEL